MCDGLFPRAYGGRGQQDHADDARRSILGRRLLLKEIYPIPAEFEGTTRQTLIDSFGSNLAASHAPNAAVQDKLQSLEGVELDKTHIMLVGPTGSGKTLLAKTLARLDKVSIVIANATYFFDSSWVRGRGCLVGFVQTVPSCRLQH
uniref:ATPase AAA-type core domain-containing protein n=1 Tax=Hyaloperonospora arabidopsidis (strain Emoy2) TaxID=559515 RepID=M4BPY1_HYAAE